MQFSYLLMLFAMFAIFKTWKSFSKKRTSITWTSLWTLLWMGLILVSLQPRIADRIARMLGVEKGADLIAYASIAVLVYAVYRLFVRTEQHRNEVTKLTRELAIARASEPMQKNSCCKKNICQK
ncbi:MAG: DUF2304 domain-containing protein [bacterium]|nr:DUF2304 domain-containing protein [bacterium]